LSHESHHICHQHSGTGSCREQGRFTHSDKQWIVQCKCTAAKMRAHGDTISTVRRSVDAALTVSIGSWKSRASHGCSGSGMSPSRSMPVPCRCSKSEYNNMRTTLGTPFRSGLRCHTSTCRLPQATCPILPRVVDRVFLFVTGAGSCIRVPEIQNPNQDTFEIRRKCGLNLLSSVHSADSVCAGFLLVS